MVEIGKVSEEKYLFLESWKFEWEIDGILSYSKTETDYRSPYFCANGEKWYIKLLSVGTPDDLEYFSLYLYRCRTIPMSFEYTFGIKTVNNTVDCELSGISAFHENGWGWDKFIKRSELLIRKSQLIPSGILTITCAVRIELSKPDLYSIVGCTDLSIDFINLLTSKENSDVTFYVKDYKCLAHRTILAARSPVFSAMFRNDTIEKKTGVVKVSDCDPKVFMVFLMYLYSGFLHFQGCNICGLYKISHKYNVPKLKLMCVDFMTEHLSLDNFCEILILSHEFQENELSANIQNFFNKNFENIVSSDSWALFTENNFRLANTLLKSMAPKVKIIE